MNMVASLFNLAGPESILIGAFSAFTVWMVVDCSMNGRASWGIAGSYLAIFCVPLLGPLVYFFGRKIVRPRRGKSASALVAPLAFFAALMASVASAAAQITYSLTPITLQDQLNPAYTDTLTGTILLAGTGSFTASANPNELLTYSLTMTSRDPSVPSVTASGSMTLSETENFEGTLTATDSALILSYGGNFEFWGSDYADNYYVFTQWDDASGNQLDFYAGESDPSSTLMQMDSPDANTVLGNGNWTIGTAVIPEPVSLLPLGLGWVAFWLCLRAGWRLKVTRPSCSRSLMVHMNALILTGLLLSTTTSFAQGTHFLVAIKGERNPRSNLSGWDVDIGEVYQFVRGMSASEYNGGPSQSDNTYVVLQIDDVQVVARTEDFLPVADKDTVQAAMKYNEEVTQHRQDDQQVAAVPQEQQAQPGGQATPVPGLHHRFTDPRIEARYEAIAQGLIAEGKDASNEAVMAILQPELNGQATAQSQAQDIQNLQGEVNQTQQQIDQVRQDQQSESFDRAVQQQQQDGEHFQQQNEQDAQQAQQQLNNTYPPQ